MYIVAIMITAAVFSITGLGVLNLALQVNFDTDAAARAIEERLDADSAVNIALWKVNSGGDTLGNYTDGNVTSVFDSTELTLTVSIAGSDDTTGYRIYLERDHHFKHALASQFEIEHYSYIIETEPNNLHRDNFDFLPEADLSYWMARADSVFADNARLFQDGDLPEGVLIFTGTANKFQGMNLTNTTMVFSGGGEVEFRQSNTIKAAYTDSTVNPALVFTDSVATIYFHKTNLSRIDSVIGPIYSLGSIRIGRSALSGPVVGRDIAVIANVDMLDEDYPQFYTNWPQGFDLIDTYDWPKQILRWEDL